MKIKQEIKLYTHIYIYIYIYIIYIIHIYYIYNIIYIYIYICRGAGEFFVKNWIIKLYFHLPSSFVYMNSRKNSGGINYYFCKSTRE